MSYLADLVTIRDQFVAELKAEMTRRAALVAAGHPPPMTASMGGKSVSHDTYVNTMLSAIEKWNLLVIQAGGEGIAEEWVRCYT